MVDDKMMELRLQAQVPAFFVATASFFRFGAMQKQMTSIIAAAILSLQRDIVWGMDLSPMPLGTTLSSILAEAIASPSLAPLEIFPLQSEDAHRSHQSQSELASVAETIKVAEKLLAKYTSALWRWDESHMARIAVERSNRQVDLISLCANAGGVIALVVLSAGSPPSSGSAEVPLLESVDPVVLQEAEGLLKHLCRSVRLHVLRGEAPTDAAIEGEPAGALLLAEQVAAEVASISLDVFRYQTYGPPLPEYS